MQCPLGPGSRGYPLPGAEFGATFSGQLGQLNPWHNRITGVTEDDKPILLDVSSSGYPGPVSAQVEICERVPEEYAPFHVNVTRDVPPTWRT
jgi:hypothetical protein